MASKPYVDVDDFKRRVENDIELIQELFRIYLEDIGGYLEEIENAMSNKDLEGLIDVSHSVKGMSANISAVAVRDNAYRLENLAKNQNMENMPKVLDELKNSINMTKEILNHYLKDGGI